MQTSRNYQYSCHETSVTCPTRIASHDILLVSGCEYYYFVICFIVFRTNFFWTIFLKIEVAPHTKQCVNIIKIDAILLFRDIIASYSGSHNVACKHVAKQRPRNTQIYGSRRWVRDSQTNMFPWKQLNSDRRTVFPMRSVPKGYRLTTVQVTKLLVWRWGRIPPP
jgi:hypothetical protein